MPFNSLLKLATDGVIDREFINKVIEKAKSEENSAIVVKKVEDGEILIDANSFSSYKIKDDKITKIPFSEEEVQTALGDEKENTAFQQGVVNIIKNSVDTGDDLPATIDKDAFVSILRSTPYDRRKFTSGGRDQHVILIPDGESQYVVFTKQISGPPSSDSYTEYNYGRRGDWRERDSRDPMSIGDYRAYFAYLRNENQVYDSAEIIRRFRNGGGVSSRKDFFRAQPPLSPTDQYATAIGANDVCYLVNKANPRNSYKISETSGKLISANISPVLARQLTGATPDQATPAAQLGAGQAIAAPIGTRRGRPAGQPNAPRATVAPPAGGGNISVSEVMDETGLMAAFNALPRADRNRLNVANGLRVNPNGDRGAARRNNQLGGAGSVGRVISVGPSKIYIIRLANQQIIASINIQPGNRNYILLPGGTMVTLNSPSDLMQALTQRNLLEVRNYLVREYIANNPQHISEVRELIQKHIAETKNQ